METLVIVTEKGTEKYLLNTNINQKTLENQVNTIIDCFNVIDWYIEDGWTL